MDGTLQELDGSERLDVPVNFPGGSKQLLLLLAWIFACGFWVKAVPSGPLPLGSPAPDFNLQGTDLQMHSLAAYAKAKILVIIFTSNHCSAAQAYEERVKQLVTDYQARAVQVIAIMPNDPAAVGPDELGYSEYGDSFEEMRMRSRDKRFNFPYLYDGDSGSVSGQFGVLLTPQAFVFDSSRLLRYTGRIDDSPDPSGKPQHRELRDAIESLLSGKQVSVTVSEPQGCGLSRGDAKKSALKRTEEWVSKPVLIGDIYEDGIQDVLSNPSGKLRLVNIWASWCAPCIREFPELVNINRMYQARPFELVTISLDALANKKSALSTLRRFHSTGRNFLFRGSMDKLIRMVDPRWDGALPYTLLVEPGGKVIYGKRGGFQPGLIKKMIVDHPLLGRY
jgi:thiol-disulfide isomerase/thioredoxin